MKEKIISIGIWCAAAVLTILLWVLSLLGVILTGLWDADRRFVHQFARGWSWALVKMNPFWHLTVEGRELLDPRRHYVFVSNHQSIADIALLPFVGIPYKCFAKAELFKVPFFGWSLSLHRHIKLARGSIQGIRRAMEDARYWIGRQMSVGFFAEGTRNRTGSLGEFKSGAFKLAIQTKTAIVPLVMVGTRDTIPKGDWIFRHSVHGFLKILPPIDTSALGMEDVECLKQQVFSSIQKILTKTESMSAGTSGPTLQGEWTAEQMQEAHFG